MWHSRKSHGLYHKEHNSIGVEGHKTGPALPLRTSPARPTTHRIQIGIVTQQPSFHALTKSSFVGAKAVDVLSGINFFPGRFPPVVASRSVPGTFDAWKPLASKYAPRSPSPPRPR